jgi:6-pyruvoyltetrahydropterin/6-carboxytetrahydropterin synthase
MFTLRKEFRFEAAHRLEHHAGKCFRLHGHSWKGVIEVVGDDLSPAGPEANMLIDYGSISAALKPMVERFLDHQYLNETLASDSPTSEYIAKWIFGFLSGGPLTINGRAQLKAVEIEETCTSSCRYER